MTPLERSLFVALDDLTRAAHAIERAIPRSTSFWRNLFRGQDVHDALVWLARSQAQAEAMIEEATIANLKEVRL